MGTRGGSTTVPLRHPPVLGISSITASSRQPCLPPPSNRDCPSRVSPRVWTTAPAGGIRFRQPRPLRSAPQRLSMTAWCSFLLKVSRRFVAVVVVSHFISPPRCRTAYGLMTRNCVILFLTPARSKTKKITKNRKASILPGDLIPLQVRFVPRHACPKLAIDLPESFLYVPCRPVCLRCMPLTRAIICQYDLASMPLSH